MKPFIGIEIHVQLNTESKMFCGCPADVFDLEPNTAVCPVCLGLPGALPVPNARALELALEFARLLGCRTDGEETHFDRKSYFYPDLPKGYQISQFSSAIGLGGSVRLENSTVRIRRIHLEEDTAKISRDGTTRLLDFNRSGMPLLELVTEPDFESPEEVVEFLGYIANLLTVHEIADIDYREDTGKAANLHKGVLRIEPSISVGPDNQLPDYRVELKNINSFRFARQALNYEIERQKQLLDEGEKIIPETRGWNERKKETVAQRRKEEAQDYRYFPEADIPVFSTPGH